VDSARPDEHNRKWPLEGFFSCGTGLVVSPECLGRSFRAKTATYDLTVTLPNLVSERPGAPLRRPALRFNVEGRDPNGHEADDEWGTVGTLRTHVGDEATITTAVVAQCIIASEVDAVDDDTFMDAVRLVGEEVDDWWTWICDWISVITEQDLTGLGTREDGLFSREFHAWSGGADGIRRASIGYGQHVVGARVGVLDPSQLQKVMDLVANDLCPETEWLFIRDARSLLRAGDYRRAVIDAGSAAELALTELLRRRLTNVDPVIRDTLLERNRGLDRRAVLTRDLNAGTVPNTFAENLNRPRTRATHGQEPLAHSEAKAAVEEATAIVAQAYPLPKGFEILNRASPG
jgi:hypothetical protein